MSTFFSALGWAGVLASSGPPVIISASRTVADPAGGDVVVLTGSNFLPIDGLHVGSGSTWTALGSSGLSAYGLTLTMPAMAPGDYFFRVTTVLGTSNLYPIRVWSPFHYAKSTLGYDSKILATAYNAGTGLWPPRLNIMAGSFDATLETTSFSTGDHPASAGAPVFDGNGSVEGGLKAPDNAWTSHYVGPNTGGYVEGGIWAVLSFTNDQTIPPSDGTADPIYDDPLVIASGLSTLGISTGRRAGDDVPIIRGFVYDGSDGGYRGASVEASQDVLHSLVMRWSLAVGGTDPAPGSLEVILDGALSGPGYAQRSLMHGLDASYLAYVFCLGLSYPPNAVAQQLFAGTVPAWGVMNGPPDNTFLTNLEGWRAGRYPS